MQLETPKISLDQAKKINDFPIMTHRSLEEYRKNQLSPRMFFRKPSRHRTRELRFRSSLFEDIHYIHSNQSLKSMINRNRSSSSLVNINSYPDIFLADNEQKNASYSKQVRNKKCSLQGSGGRNTQQENEIKYLKDKNKRLIEQNTFCMSKIKQLSILLEEKDLQLNKFFRKCKQREKSLYRSLKKISQKDRVIRELQKTLINDEANSHKLPLLFISEETKKDNKFFPQTQYSTQAYNIKSTNLELKLEHYIIQQKMYKKLIQNYQEQLERNKKIKALNRQFMQEQIEEVQHLYNSFPQYNLDELI